MSYRVYLIDDEWFMVRNIAEQVEWEKYGMEVVGTANSADTALREIERLMPELIITDIMMPGKTGIDLIRELHAKNTTAVMLIISAHDRFSFAKEAISCGVADYLLKPIRFEELDSALWKVAERIKKEQRQRREYMEMSEALERANRLESPDTDGGEQDSSVLKQIKTYIQEHFKEKLNIQGISDRFFLTPNYLSTVFKKATGETILEYITRLRITEAKRLLRENRGMKMYEVAERVGYGDQEHFRRIFKKYTGVNPTRFK